MLRNMARGAGEAVNLTATDRRESRSRRTQLLLFQTCFECLQLRHYTTMQIQDIKYRSFSNTLSLKVRNRCFFSSFLTFVFRMIYDITSQNHDFFQHQGLNKASDKILGFVIQMASTQVIIKFSISYKTKINAHPAYDPT